MGALTRWAMVVGLVVALAEPAAASAVILAPPGKAGADQYFETIPTAAGNAAPPSGSASATAQLHHSRSGRRGISGLTRLGRDGKAAATLAAATQPSSFAGTGAPRPAAAPGPARHGSAGPAPTGAGGSTGNSAVGSIVDALGGAGGGMGTLLPVLLALSALVAIALGLTRRSQRG